MSRRPSSTMRVRALSRTRGVRSLTLLRRMVLARAPADFLHDTIGRQLGCSGFLSHLHSLAVTMSQKPSVTKSPQGSHGRRSRTAFRRFRSRRMTADPLNQSDSAQETAQMRIEQHCCDQTCELKSLISGIFSGWGTWIRTRTDGVRVRCSTVKLFPKRPTARRRVRGR